MPRHAITVSQKASLRAQHKSNPSLDHEALRQWFRQEFQQNVSQSSVSEILSARYQDLDRLAHKQHVQVAKRRRAERWPLLEAALQEWLVGISHQTATTPDMLREKALWFFQRIPEYRGLSPPKFSSSWIASFKARHQTVSSLNSDNISRDASQTLAGEDMCQVKQMLSAYQPEDQYICADTILYWKMIPESALSKAPICRLEENKTQFSALLCTNIDGSYRLPPWYVGRNPNPQAFTSAGVNINALDMVWKHNRSARMTRAVFKEFLHWFDARMQGRKVALLLDELSARQALDFDPPPPSLQISRDLDLKNTLVIYLPISCNDVYRQMKQEVTGIWKTYYRRSWIHYICDQLSAHRNPLTTMNVMKAVEMACCAWLVDVSPQNICNCFSKFGTLGIATQDLDDEKDADLREAKQQLHDNVKKLEQVSFIHEAMGISAIINPPFESCDMARNAWAEAEEEEQMSARASSTQVPEGDSDEEIEHMPRISPHQALEAISCLRLFEKQSENGVAAFVTVLDRHERIIQQRQRALLQMQQNCIPLD